MPYQLQVLAGPDKGKSFPVHDGQTLVIGRNRNVAIALNDPSVSRAHCQLKMEGERFFIADLGSSTGTWVEGEQVERQELEADDVFQIGDTRIRLADEEEEAAGRPPVLPAERLEELTGSKLSHYEVGRVLAKGQSGLVFSGKDRRNSRPVALKIFWPEFSRDKKEMKRFVRAMKTMMPLKHTHLVSIFGAGLTSPYCWIAMEYVEGESLTQIIQKIGAGTPPDWQQALRVAIHISRALVFAHYHRIVHRNISPPNILLRNDHIAKLGDLMMGRALEGGASQFATKPGELIGEIHYMPPERTTGVPTDLDQRSDIYSLGATVYALLTGRPPLKGSSFVETILKIRQEKPISPKSVVAGLPAPFEAAVMKMLAKKPEERFQSAAELLGVLEKIAKEHGVSVN